MDRLKNLVNTLQKIDTYRQIHATLSWDQETMMPNGAIDVRATQLAELSRHQHDCWNHSELCDQMHALMDADTGTPIPTLSHDERRFMEELIPIWRRHTHLSNDLIARLAETAAKTQHVWQTARQHNDFSGFAPHLQRMIDLQHEKINQLGVDGHPYNALLDDYEPGMTVDKLDALFEPLKQRTMRTIQTKGTQNPRKIMGMFDVHEQLAYSTHIASLLQYDFNRGRLDTSAHPFTIDSHPSDVRITTRVSKSNILEALSSTIHEVGHGLYEQGLDADWIGTPFGMARSMGVHESQSRLYEVFIGQSLAFWEGQLDELHRRFPDMRAYSAQDLYDITHQITPHWCRVESDIVSYNLHIILRYECEKALIDGTLRVNDLPLVWNEKMRTYLGIDVASDTHGCLQDVHWSAGLFGYFPSYTLGTMMAEKLYNRLHQQFDDLDRMIRTSNFKPINEWLTHSIYRHGCRLPTNDLMEHLDASICSH